MFYEHFVLAKDGPLGIVWIAAHWERKVTKRQVLDTNINDIAGLILDDRFKLSLRLYSHLLCGISRIFNRKVTLLYEDCSEAFIKFKLAFRASIVDLDFPAEANIQTITRPERYEFEVVIPTEIPLLEEIPEPEEGLIPFELKSKEEIESFFPLIDISVTDTYGLTPQDIDDLSLKLHDYLSEPSIEPFPDATLAPFIDQADIGFRDLTPEPITPLPLQVLETALQPLPRARRIRKRRYKVDKATELPGRVMRRTIEDPESLKRELIRAPPTRELMRRRHVELEGYENFFHMPNEDFLHPTIVNLILRNMVPGEIDLPPRSHVHDFEPGFEPGLGFEPAFEPSFEPDVYYPPASPIPLTTEPDLDLEPGFDHSSAISVEPDDRDKDMPITERTRVLERYLDRKFVEMGDDLIFQELLAGKEKYAIAVSFCELLTLASKQQVQVRQEAPYENIFISRNPED